MSLTQSLSVALSGLSATTQQTNVISRNITSAGGTGASRKVAQLATTDVGGVRVVSVTRVANAALLARLLAATSSTAKDAVVAGALDQFSSSLNDPASSSSLPALVAKLNTTLQTFASAPDNTSAATAATSAAGDLVTGLNEATQVLQKQRAVADNGLANSVATINSLLNDFQRVNDTIVTAGATGADVTDVLDERDRILTALSEQIGIRTIADGASLSIYTDQGLTLFNGVPRPVTFQATSAFTAATKGNAVYIDGVPVTGGGNAFQATSGALAGYAIVRDQFSVTYQSQLDAVAAGLIAAFAEPAGSDSGLPALAGLFTDGASATLPGDDAVPGLAGRISVNVASDPARGGNPLLLRDGGMNGADYVANAGGGAGFSDRLQHLLDSLSSSRSFPSSGLSISGSIEDMVSASAGWLQSQRQSAWSHFDQNDAIRSYSATALSNDVGVNIDEEMVNLLQHEKTYQALALLMQTIDEFIKILLQMSGR